MRMDAPSCRNCQTAKYLRILKFERLHFERDDVRSAQGRIQRPPRRVEAEAAYFCGQCGSFDGHSVPEDWFPPEHVMSDHDILVECGQFAPEPRRITRMTPDGGTVTTS